MRIDLRKNALILVFFLFGLMLLYAGFHGRFGLVLGAIFTPEYLTVKSG
jgi:hypothetical protein